MHAHRNNLTHGALVAALALAGCMTGADDPATAPSAVRGGAAVVPPTGRPYGATYAAWADRWVQWMMAQPATVHPLLENTGEHCAQGQSGPVWFLGGSLVGESPITRRCAVPAGTALFFPIVNAWADNVGVDPPMTVEQLRGAIAWYIFPARSLSASIDGAAVEGLDRYHFTSAQAFSYTLPPSDNVLQYFGYDVSGPVTPAVSDGYWVMVPPLSPGRHVLRFSAVGAQPFVVVDMTYELTVAR